MKTGIHIKIKGIVQGVGFRPFIYRIARKYNLSGFVRNSTFGVEIEAFGEKIPIENFLLDIKKFHPPAAQIHNIELSEIPYEIGEDFRIVSSEESYEVGLIPPDLATCKECLSEMLDPGDRRFKYPFINCTQCGPRFSIIRELPYDRCKTTMQEFALCPDCQKEYDSILSRRFHAEPNACPVCGPKYYLKDIKGKAIHREPIKTAIDRINSGKIVAVKGIGGFLLACDATKDDVVRLLRERKSRPKKPFAIMAKDIETIREIAHTNHIEEELLTSPAAPILLLRKKKNSILSEFIAPENGYIGVMLPYSPVHHLLIRGVRTNYLIMTSGNRRDEPIICDDSEVFEKLSGIADFVLGNNRGIYNRLDDSILTVAGKQAIFIRRARGYVPLPLELAKSYPAVLGTGAELKSNFTIISGNRAFTSQYSGDLNNLSSEQFYRENLEKFTGWLKLSPILVVSDMHPDYFTTRFAEELNIKHIKLQHHKAHLLSVLAEQPLSRAAGIILDGQGLGDDGAVWGGEFFLSEGVSIKRIGHLRYVPQIGGDAATKNPYRMAFSYLLDAFGDTEYFRELFPDIQDEEIANLNALFKSSLTPLTSSCGRLFDGVSAILGLIQHASFEAEAPMALEAEAISSSKNIPPISYKINFVDGKLILDYRPTIRAIVERLKAGEDRGDIAGSFHKTVADMILTVSQYIRDSYNVNSVILSGGVFQNRLLLTLAMKILNENGFSVYINSYLPPNDGCISLGQAYFGAESTL